jgi:CDK inhibitor PHO81
LIAGGAEVNVVDTYGRTALWYAARDGHIECVTVLLDVKADVNKADIGGYTPLHQASFRGHVKCVRVRCLCGWEG